MFKLWSGCVIGVWPLKRSHASSWHDTLAVSFVDQTAFLAIQNEEVWPICLSVSRCLTECSAGRDCEAQGISSVLAKVTYLCARNLHPVSSRPFDQLEGLEISGADATSATVYCGNVSATQVSTSGVNGNASC